jgi:predicted flap endonuclease-1-like 5' DNA nuclease
MNERKAKLKPKSKQNLQVSATTINPVLPRKSKVSPATSVVLSLNFPIEQLPGLSAKDYTIFKSQGIITTQALLQRAGRSRSQQEALAAALGMRWQFLYKWLVFADLARISGIGCQYCGLIVHSGVGSIEQLAQTSVGKLHEGIKRLQVQTLQRTDLCPSLQEMSSWIKQAQQLVARKNMRE